MTPFLHAALIRAVRTAAQTAVGVLGAGVVSLVDIDFAAVASVSGGAALVSLLTSVATGLPEVEAGGRDADE